MEDRSPGPKPSSGGNSRQQQDWRVSFGFWTELDALYESHAPPAKPRLPALPHDSIEEWKKRLIPDRLDQFLGNPAATTCLHTVATSGESGFSAAFTNFIISGGGSTGKASFAGLLRKAFESLDVEQSCRFATLNASELVEKALLNKVGDAIRRLDASKTGSASFLTIERFEYVTPSVQQHYLVPLLASANAKNVFFILLVRPDTNKLAEQIKLQATKVHLLPLAPDLVRTKLLLVCQQERIGYKRDGLEALGDFCGFKLVSCLEKLREAFVTHYYLSHANVLKLFASPFSPSASSSSSATSVAVAPFPLSIIRMSEPLRRCPKCTLIPPCSHIPLTKLFSKIEHIRALYPHNGSGPESVAPIAVDGVSSTDKADNSPPGDISTEERPAICPSFRRRGVCSNIQTLSRCRYAHPLDLHTIDTSALVQRCRAHTLPLPCLHCRNAEQLAAVCRTERTTCEQLRRELLRAKQTLADLETQRYLFARSSGKVIKWGSAKKEADEHLARLDAALNTTKASIKRQGLELQRRQEALETLEDDMVHGRSRGLGKGHGREQPETGSDNPQPSVAHRSKFSDTSSTNTAK